MPPPPLPDELIEEIFLRLPPAEPAWLVRASLASKLWLGLLTGPAFHARYRDFHGAAPMLGFFQSGPHFVSEEDPLFVSTTKFSARVPDHQHWRSYGGDPLDGRHGRVAIGYKDFFLVSLVAWDPMTGRWWDLGEHDNFTSYGAAVLCAAAGCDHRACHRGPFRVVFLGLENLSHGGTAASVWLHSLETDDECSDSEPSEVCSVHFEASGLGIEPTCSVLVQDALYFVLVHKDDDDRVGILKFDLSSNCLSLIDAPLELLHTAGATILMGMEDGSLGFAYVDGSLTLYLWSRQLGSDGAASWTQCKVISLKGLLPILNPENRLTLIGSVEGCNIIFVNTDLGIYEINLSRDSGPGSLALLMVSNSCRVGDQVDLVVVSLPSW